MTSHGDFSPEAGDRASHTVDASAVFAANAEHIVELLDELPEGSVLVVHVDADKQYNGGHQVDQGDLVERIPEIEDGGWSMVFRHGTTPDEVRARAAEFGSIAQKRADIISRIQARRSEADNGTADAG